MKQSTVKIKSIIEVTHDVLSIVTEKPQQFFFTPGQAVDVSINKDDWKDKKRPFTITSHPKSDTLEFTIKTYPSHKGVTNEFLKLRKDDELILYEVFGAISYKGEGLFIAGGAGVTPFISIFRYLHSNNEIGNNKLIFANKTKSDIIYEKELKMLLNKNCINILSDEKVYGYNYGHITASFIKVNSVGINKIFYICGPPPMMESIEELLSKLCVDEQSIVKEIF